LSSTIKKFLPYDFGLPGSFVSCLDRTDAIFFDEGDGNFPLAADTVTGGSITVSAAKPVATIAGLADYLVTGFWSYNNALPHHWASNTITYNVTGLNPDEQFLARSALAAWHDVANITFVETTGSANITFTHNGSMQAVTSASWYGSGAMASATVNISTDWVTTDGGANDGKTGIDSYAYQTYLHEIGHALGLGHQGPYNGSANYSTNAIFANDTWQYSLMSYFSQPNYGGSSYRYVVTPQMADIHAVAAMYGAATTTRTGDTVYGFNSNAGAVFSFAAYTSAPALTIYDNGGSDTLDCSLYSNAQTITLIAGNFSSIGGLSGNIGIANGCTIENAIGGAGSDTIIGNGANNLLRGNAGTDSIDGGAGTDTAVFAGNRSAYTLTDLGNGNVRVVGPDGSDTLTNVERLQFADQTVSWPPAGADVDHPANDFNGDFASDLLWVSNGGAFSEWRSNGSGFTPNVFVGSIANGWHSEGTFDFNGDSRADLVWRNDTTGQFTIWNSTGNGFTPNSFVGNVGTSWTIAALADFNGDGLDDMIFRNANGTFTEWQSTGAGFTPNVYVGAVDNSWHLAAAADFNGDGKADLLWRNDNGSFTEWQSNGNGFTPNVYGASVDRAWHVLTTGDFNGDGKDDLIFRHDNGTFTEWQSTGNGFTSNVFVGAVGNDWQLAQTGDFNGDGKDDLLWRNTNGTFTEWQSTGNSFTPNVVVGHVGTDWNPITHHYDVV